MTEDERRANRLASHEKYNKSKKGIARNQKYEKAHPLRKLRWEAARNNLRRNNV